MSSFIAKNYPGLSSGEAAEREQAGQANTPVEAPFKSNWQIVKDNTFTYFNAVFIGLAVILFSVGAYRSMTFIPIIIINTMIGIVQELRAKSILKKLTVLSARDALVFRDGKEQKIPTDRLVLDDIIVLKAGNQIPADAEILDGSVSVNEALLTGEADEVQKSASGNKELLSGSFIVSGECVAKLTKVGADAYAAKLTLQAKAIKTGEQSEIIASLNKLVKYAGIVLIPVALLLFARQFFLLGDDLPTAVQGMAAAVIGMIPEGLFLLASVALALSAVRLAMNKVLVHEMKCIETLARVDVLCADKTGTITSPDMSVSKVLLLENPRTTENVLKIFVHSLSADNETMAALKRHFEKPAEAKTKAKAEKEQKAEKTFGFSSQYKYSAAKIDGKNYVLGAPEFILKEDYETYKAKIEPYSKKGYRVLVFASYSGKLDGGELKASSRPLALIMLMNPVRETAPETFRYFAEQGVEIKVISGDNPLTVSEVAKQAGIKNAEKYIDARELKSDKDYEKAVKTYTVFGRVLPEQKRKLVKALQKQNHTVAMTGDGVNDVLALKDADCSIAMASGSDAAVQAAQLVLLESDFSKMPSVVREGRRVVNNLERSGSLFIVKNIFSFTAAAFSILLGFRYPLLPAQVSMVTMWVIGVPSFFLSQMPNEELIKGRFMHNILKKAIAGGLTNVVVVLLTNLLCTLLAVPADETSTACTLAFAIVGMIYLYRVCRPFNLYRKIVWLGCLAGLTVCFLFFRWFFELVDHPTLATALIPAVVGLITPFVLTFFEKLTHKIYKN